LADQIAGLENAGLEKAGPENVGQENAGLENAGLENAGLNVFYFLPLSYIVSTSLYISIESEALMLRACHLAHLCVCLCVCLSVCLSVCPESVLWQNG